MGDIKLNQIKTSDFIGNLVNNQRTFKKELNRLLPVFPELVGQICDYLDSVSRLDNPPEDCYSNINGLITNSSLSDKNQNLVRLALNSYFQDRIKLGKILAGVEQIPSFSFKDSAGQYWQGASISLAGVHTLTNSDRIFAPKDGSSILAAVADGVTLTIPPKKENETFEELQTNWKLLLNNPEARFSYKSNLLGQKVADAVIKSLDNPEIDDDKFLDRILNNISNDDFPNYTSGSCTLSCVHRDENKIQLQTIGDSPIFIFNKKKNKIYYTENISEEVLTSSIHVERFPDEKRITPSEPERYNSININDVGWIMVASDGIFETNHKRDQVKTLLEQNKYKTPQEIIQEVLRSAHQAGSNDDISIVLVKPVSKLNQLLYVLAALMSLQPRANRYSFASNSPS
jgi:serine/threonine protein phosphatase PrpC